MLPVNAISLAARELRKYLSSELGVLETNIIIGNPKEGVEAADNKANEQYLNLFFYRIENGAYPADAMAESPYYVRLHCMITALGNTETSDGSTISAGENDLRLIGGVMQLLHQKPHVSINNTDGDEIAQLQVINIPLTLDDINNIWSTQGDVAYRLSVGYEMALAPLLLTPAHETSPRVGSIGAAVEQGMGYSQLPDEGFSVYQQSQGVKAIQVNDQYPEWSPHICFVANDGAMAYSLAFDNASIPAQLGVIGIGLAGTTVELAWQIWDKVNGWQEVAPSGENLDIHTAAVDPATLDMGMVQNVTQPLSDNGQAMLYARRSWTRPDGSSVTLRSNPLLVTVYGGGS